MSIFVQSSNSKQPKTEILTAINEVNFAWEENLPYSLQSCQFIFHSNQFT